MGRLLGNHPHFHVNFALVIAFVWAALAVASAIIDIERMVQAW
jgi:hypothetical protein